MVGCGPIKLIDELFNACEVQKHPTSGTERFSLFYSSSKTKTFKLNFNRSRRRYLQNYHIERSKQRASFLLYLSCVRSYESHKISRESTMLSVRRIVAMKEPNRENLEHR
jgi:hypothetical protein